MISKAIMIWKNYPSQELKKFGQYFGPNEENFSRSSNIQKHKTWPGQSLFFKISFSAQSEQF